MKSLHAFFIITFITVILFTYLAYELIVSQNKISTLSSKAKDESFLDIASKIRFVVNMNRLKTAGDIIYSSSDTKERLKARVTAQVIAFDPIFDENPKLKSEVNEIWKDIKNIYFLKNQVDIILTNVSTSFEVIQNLTLDSQFSVIRDSIKLIIDKKHLSNINLVILSMDNMNSEIKSSPIFKQMYHLAGLLLNAHIMETEANLLWKLKSEIIDSIQQTVNTTTLHATESGIEQVLGISQSADNSKHKIVVFVLIIGLLFTILGILLYIFVFAPIVRITNALHNIENGEENISIKKELLKEIDEIGKATTLVKNTLNNIQQQQILLETLATTDQLTGLYNRRYFFDIANKELSRVKRHHTLCSLLMLDIDHFKSINDTYGHNVGDKALKLFSHTISSLLRDNDVFARIGGEEFVILLLETNQQQAFKKGLDIIKSIEKLSINTNENGLLKFTVSIGVSALNISDTEIQCAISRADSALYRAKTQGRNQVVEYINS
ncbi:GGDEF domain-containing protein [Arcobacter sp. FWKO B]|uniref:GGDEF domain-containing protein n=1 Tax=Arcobacter sp. FWKO B TaxID=2593672 RepID=UPI0018A46637|nr:GGDEF domain-containing protein [Arcobacter sp. FWKO B]QOG12282.1 GGDEF domain-containing protein [Arcobacter sp. FWKO B]